MKRALLVIDAQKAYTDAGSDLYCRDADRTVSHINRLVDRFAARGEPIFFIRHMYRADGSDLGRMYDYLGESGEDFRFKENSDEVGLDPNLKCPEGAREIVKNRYSAFEGTSLEEDLGKLGVDRVVVCGFMTNFCCESTARQAHDRDYFVDFVTDATGTPGTRNLDQDRLRSTVAEVMEAGIARVLETRDFLKIDG